MELQVETSKDNGVGSKVIFRIEGEIKIFSDKQQLKEFTTTKASL